VTFSTSRAREGFINIEARAQLIQITCPLEGLSAFYPVAAQDHRWQITGKPRHQYQYDPFQQAWTGRL
jgi:hypothetical protein